MNQPPNNFSIFINSLLSNKEIRIDENDENNKTVQITEYSVFNHSRMIIPIDMINPEPVISKRPDKQWLLFGLLNLFAAGIFLFLAVSQQFTVPYFFSAGFVLSALFSVYAAYKHKNTHYTYQCKETRSKLFSLTENDLNSAQISEFLAVLNQNILQSIDTEIETIYNSQDKYNITSLTADNVNQTTELAIYYEHLGFLYNEGIINSSLLEELEQRAYNKVNGIPDTRPLAKVIPLHANQ